MTALDVDLDLNLDLAPRRVDRMGGAAPHDAAEPTGTSCRSTRDAVAAAVCLGVAGDLLLRGEAPGVNLLVCTALGLAMLAWLARARGRALTVGAVAVGTLALAFAAAVAWRDSTTLLVLNLLALATTACALAAVVRHGPALPIESADLGTYARGAAATVASVATGAPALVRPVALTRSATGRQVAGALGVGARGAILAFPALVVFGTLLAAADGAFVRIAKVLVDWDVGALAAHVLVAAVLAWGTAGFLRRALVPPLIPSPAPSPVRATTERAMTALGGAAEWCVALVLVDMLFVAFGIVQLGWLFGGRAIVASTTVTYAEYARRGFFELVLVAALALPTALGAYGAGMRRVRRDDPSAARMHRALRLAAGTLLGCLAVVLVSAADRMRLYQAAYGLTELRVYASAFMAWLAVVGVCATVTVLRERRAPFALGTLASTWVWVLALDAVNPDVRIVTVDVARATAARPLDTGYVASLSDDAVPALLAYMRAAPVPAPAAACPLVERLDALRLHTLQREADGADWRTWNAARRHAARTLAQPESRRVVAAWRTACPHS